MVKIGYMNNFKDTDAALILTLDAGAYLVDVFSEDDRSSLGGLSDISYEGDFHRHIELPSSKSSDSSSNESVEEIPVHQSHRHRRRRHHHPAERSITESSVDS